jgi:hypothetical protein
MSSFEPVCLITGASAGIGAALAREFARHGHALALVARRELELQALADEIAAAGNKRPHVIAADLSTEDGRERLAARLQTERLEPAFVVNNAGFGLIGRAERIDRAKQLAMIDLNNRALTDMSLRWLDSIVRHRGGILNVASIAGFLPAPGMAVYHASKAYVVSLSESLHQELADKGVRVCALCPGPVKTEFFDKAGASHDFFPNFLMRSPGRVAHEGYEGLMGGHRIVVPGAVNRIVTLLPRLLPRAWVLAGMELRWLRANRQVKKSRLS